VNDQVNRQLKRFVKNFDARSQGEKLLVMGILVIALVLVYLEVAYDPIRADISSARNQINSVRAQTLSQQSS